MRFRFYLVVSIYLLFNLPSSLAQEGFPIQIGPKKISSAQFSSIYRRLIESDSIKPDNKNKFLSDYLDLSLKLVAAEDEKLADTPGFQEEYASFRKELASPYLVDSEKVNALVKEAYQRLKDEKQVAHILVKLPANPSPGDTLIAYQKIENLYKKLKAGEDFASLAQRFSDDELTAKKGGNLGFITSLQTQYAFENKVYQLGIGEYSAPVRTSSGYHLIKILKQRPNQGKIRLAHILISVPVEAGTLFQVEAKKKIEQVEAYLKKGESYEDVCRNYSEDPYSKGRGGELRRWYYSSDLSEELQDKLFGLQRLGDISEPIRTNLGWQIFKLLDKKPLLSYEEMAEYLRQKVNTDPERSALIRQSFMKRVRVENRVAILEESKKMALERFARDRVGDEPWLQFPLFKVLDKSFTINEFYQFIVAQQRRKVKELGYLPAVSEATWLDEFIDSQTLQAEEQHLETKYPAFKEQMAEFLEGSLLSKITDREIFEKSLDSLRQHAYYQQNMSMFTMPVRAEAKLISSDNAKTLADAMELLKSAPYPMNKRYPDILFKLGQSELTANAKKVLQELGLLMSKNRDYVVEVTGHIDGTEKDTLSEGRVNQVVKFLSSKGISSVRFIEKDEGKLVSASKTDKAKNARVSFRLFSQSMDDVVKRFNAIKPKSLEATEGYFKKGEIPVLDAQSWQVGKKNLEYDGRYVYLEIKKVEEQRVKTFDECRSSIIRDLQAQLDKEWLQKLKNKYPIVIQQEELQKLMQ
ncbi:peptidylprolyl isomerase [Aquirufa nivalisilvae]